MASPVAHRSFHNTDSEYNLPNDPTEHARLESQATALADLMHNKVIHAPLTNPQRLVDVGCGTGAVTHLLATTYPSASRIYGVDLSPVPHVRRPGAPLPNKNNIDYIQGDIKQLSKRDARFAPGTFDYVFSRLLICGMTDWAGHMRNTVVPLLKPGAWVEMQDLDYVWYKHERVCSKGRDWDWVRALEQGARRKGLDLFCGSNAAGYMREAGLVDVSVRTYWMPFGEWAVGERPESRRIGKLQATELAPLYEALVPRMVDGLGLSEGEVQGLVEKSRGCLKAEDGLEWAFYVTVGRRPF